MRRDSGEEARRWIRQAENDLSAARLTLREGFFSQTCFLSHQVAEKSLKALAYFRGDRTVLGHTLGDLLLNIESDFPQLMTFQESVETLGTYYIPTRYPDALPNGSPFEIYTQDEAEEAVESASQILEAAREITSQ